MFLVWCVSLRTPCVRGGSQAFGDKRPNFLFKLWAPGVFRGPFLVQVEGTSLKTIRVHSLGSQVAAHPVHVNGPLNIRTAKNCHQTV